MNKHKLKELAQEKGYKILSYKEELLGIEQVIDNKEYIIPISHKPYRLKYSDYEEDFSTYKQRQRVMRHVEKNFKKGYKFWDSIKLGTYSKMTEDEVQTKYKELLQQEDVAAKLMEMDQKLQKQEIK